MSIVGLEATRTARAIAPRAGYWSDAWRRLCANRLGSAAGGFMLVLALVAVLAPEISRSLTGYMPEQQNLLDQFEPPGPHHWLGTDETGRDTLTRLVWGARVSLGVAFLTVFLQLAVGGGAGLLAGYCGGWLDEVLMRVVDMVLAIPAVFLFILMSILFRPNVLTLSAIIASVGWGSVARLVRSETMSLKGRDFVLAARAVGAGHARIILFHLLPNVLSVMIVAASLGVGSVILVEAALDFLGLGIPPPTASWGSMLGNAQVYFHHSIWLVVFPGAMISLAVLAANILGNTLRDALDPTLRF